MVHLVEPQRHLALDDYASVAHLTGVVRELRQEASRLIPVLGGRRLWMVNSTARGGGVAELLPPLLALLRDVGVDANWLVMDTAEPAFFEFTKRLHNLIHGQGDAHLTSAEQELHARVSPVLRMGFVDVDREVVVDRCRSRAPFFSTLWKASE
jgi:trehalose synthase